MDLFYFHHQNAFCLKILRENHLGSRFRFYFHYNFLHFCFLHYQIYFCLHPKMVGCYLSFF